MLSMPINILFPFPSFVSYLIASLVGYLIALKNIFLYDYSVLVSGGGGFC